MNRARTMDFPALSAPSAIWIGLLCAGAFFLLADVPHTWLLADREAWPAGTAPESPLFPELVLALPLAELAIRRDILIIALALALAATSGALALRLLGKAGRWPSAVVATAVSGASLAQLSGDIGSARELLVAALAMLQILAWVTWARAQRSITAFEFIRALVLAMLCTWLDARTGFALGLGTLGWMLATQRARLGLTGEDGIASQGARAIAMLGLAGVIVFVGVQREALIASLGETERLMPTGLFWPGWAALFVLAAPVRRLGARTVLAALLVVYVLELPRPLAPCLLAVGASGWVWLASTVARPRSTRIGPAFAVITAAGILAAAWLEAWSTTSLHRTVARQRAVTTPLRLYDKGLIAPRETVFVHAPWLAAAFDRARFEAGWRPDIHLVAARDQSLFERRRQFAEALARDGRILSDVFEGGELWDASAAHDSGPWFWFVGDDYADLRNLTELPRLPSELELHDAVERRRYALIEVERARFRRALEDPVAALDALSLDPTRRASLAVRLQITRDARAHAHHESELGVLDPEDTSWTADSAASSEAGDLMFAHGDHAQGTALLVEAATAGDSRALSALARWQLRAGEDSAAWETLEVLARDSTLRAETLEMMTWLLARDRVQDAARLRDLACPQPDLAPAEIAARLALLARQARSPSMKDTTSAPRTAQR